MRSHPAIVALAVALPYATALSAVAQTPAVVPSGAYTHAQQLVAIDGRRRLNLFCLGTGSPVVLLDAGAGENMMVWRHVHEQLAAVTRTCAYDRAGYGFSDSATRTSDARNAVNDLHRLIGTALAAPVVYVGHSIAGLYGSLLVATHPSDVAAVVFVDPAFPRQFPLTAASFASAERAQLAGMFAGALEQIRGCLDLARAGALVKPITKPASSCVSTKGYAEPLDGTLRRELGRQYGRPRLFSAALSEYGSFWPTADDLGNVDDQQLDAANIDFGDRPLVVLTRGNTQPPIPGVSPAHAIASDSAWVAGHERLAARSTRGSHIVVEHAGHHIQFDRPGAVIDAVRRVVRQVRGELRD